MNRRQFVQSGAAAASGLLLLKSRTAFGYDANSAVRHGLLGCGNRGTSVATSFAKNTSAQVVALADLFPDNLAAGQSHFNELNASLGRAAIDSKLLFHGPHAFEQLAASPDVDLIQISTPPFFHVQHLETAVASGKHVYCEKPVGIDIRQAQHALEIAKRVKPTQSVDVGFQCRNAPPIAAIAEKIKAGALGKIAARLGHLLCAGFDGKEPPRCRARRISPAQLALGSSTLRRHSGGTEHPHHRSMNWLLGARPLKATATGGRTILTHYGNCWDNYQVDFTYPGDVHLSFSSTQFGTDGAFDAGLRLFGANGSASVPYSGPVKITGKQPWAWEDSSASTPGSGTFAANGAFLDNLAFADRDKERTFIDSITSGNSHNQIAAGVETALSCMLGRMAGLTGREVTWEDLLAHGETYELGFSLEQFA